MRTILFPSLLLVATVAAAQESSYAGMQSRSVKALSGDEIRAYREGEGMGLALAAELNGYPGPKHILELKEKLALTDEQLSKIEAIRQRMKSDAMRLGNEIVALEHELDQAFREPDADALKIEDLTTRIGTLQGQLRFVHLRAHLESRPVLTRHQSMRYAELRGYGSGHAHGKHQH